MLTKEKIACIFDILTELKASSENSAERKALRGKFHKKIWEYAKEIWREKVKNAAVEITECADSIIRNFKGTGYDAFERYLNKSLKTVITHANEEQKVFENSTVEIPYKKRIFLKRISRYAETMGRNLDTEQGRSWLAKWSGIPPFELNTLLLAAQRTENIFVSVDREELSLFETLKVSQICRIESVETVFFKEQTKKQMLAELHLKLQEIDDVFQKTTKYRTGEQKYKKNTEYLSALLTRQILEELLQSGEIKSADITEIFSGIHFCDSQVLAEFLKTGNVPKQQDVAERFGKNKTDASRTVKNFLEKCQLCETRRV